MHSLAFSTDDRSFPHSLGNLSGTAWWRPRGINHLGGYAAAALVGTRLRYRDLGQVAPGQRRSAPSYESRLRRVVRHSPHLQRSFLAGAERHPFAPDAREFKKGLSTP